MRAPFVVLRSVLLLASLACIAVPEARAQTAMAAAVPRPAAARLAPAERLALSGLPNAGRVTEQLYRGAQPVPAGYEQLQQLGIAIVVDLHNHGAAERRERRAVESRGMRYVSLPASPIQGPTGAQIAQFFQLLRDNPGRKIFVHCKHGADRTGVMIAVFRMAWEHWTPAQAMAEMHAFHFHSFWHPTMRHTVRTFPQTYKSNPVFASLRTPSPVR